VLTVIGLFDGVGRVELGEIDIRVQVGRGGKEVAAGGGEEDE
jgi:hypothetical protein